MSPGTCQNLCNDNVSVDKNFTPVTQTSTSLPVYRSLLPYVLRTTGVDPTLCTSRASPPAEPSPLGRRARQDSAAAAYLAIRIPRSFPRRPPRATAKHRRGGTTHRLHPPPLLPSIPFTSKGTRDVDVTSRQDQLPEHCPNRARRFRRSNHYIMQLGKHGAAWPSSHNEGALRGRPARRRQAGAQQLDQIPPKSRRRLRPA